MLLPLLMNLGMFTAQKSAPGGISGANGPFGEYDGRKPGEPWKVPQWAIEERERLLQEAEAVRARGGDEAEELRARILAEAVHFSPTPTVKGSVDLSVFGDIRPLMVPEINDDEDAAMVLLLSE